MPSPRGQNSTSFVVKTIRLVAQAPNIIEAILDGHESNGLSLKSMRRDISLSWGDQRVELGASHAL